jgi:hypothetical protein
MQVFQQSHHRSRVMTEDICAAARALLCLAKARLHCEEVWAKGFDIGMYRDGDIVAFDFDDPATAICCATGAIELEARIGGFSACSWRLAEDTLHDGVPPPFASAIGFNDHDDTTLADIHALFDRAIAALS